LDVSTYEERLSKALSSCDDILQEYILDIAGEFLSHLILLVCILVFRWSHNCVKLGFKGLGFLFLELVLLSQVFPLLVCLELLFLGSSRSLLLAARGTALREVSILEGDAFLADLGERVPYLPKLASSHLVELFPGGIASPSRLHSNY
jgi:hypothetical protein